jgi:hypothetical protein
VGWWLQYEGNIEDEVLYRRRSACIQPIEVEWSGERRVWKRVALYELDRHVNDNLCMDLATANYRLNALGMQVFVYSGVIFMARTTSLWKRHASLQSHVITA